MLFKNQIVERILKERPDFFNKNTPEISDVNLPILERKKVKDLIEKRVIIVGKLLPISEYKIRQRLLKFIQNSLVARKYEQACCRHIKQFFASAFLICEVCNTEHDHLCWDFCKNCGSFNKYKI